MNANYSNSSYENFKIFLGQLFVEDLQGSASVSEGSVSAKENNDNNVSSLNPPRSKFVNSNDREIITCTFFVRKDCPSYNR